MRAGLFVRRCGAVQMATGVPIMGRPSLKTPELCEEIEQRLSKGEPLLQICRDEWMPTARAVYNWIDADAELSSRIARAREIGFDAIALDALAIADETTHDTVKRQDGSEAVNGEWISRSKLRVETRLKLLAKWDPKRYGDAVTVKGDKDNPLPVEHRWLTPEKLATLSDATVAEIAGLEPDAG